MQGRRFYGGVGTPDGGVRYEGVGDLLGGGEARIKCSYWTAQVLTNVLWFASFPSRRFQWHYFRSATTVRCTCDNLTTGRCAVAATGGVLKDSKAAAGCDCSVQLPGVSSRLLVLSRAHSRAGQSAGAERLHR